MFQYDLNATDGILTLTPQGPLAASDFEALRAEVDPFIERNGALRGLLIEGFGAPREEHDVDQIAHRAL